MIRKALENGMGLSKGQLEIIAEPKKPDTSELYSQNSFYGHSRIIKENTQVIRYINRFLELFHMGSTKLLLIIRIYAQVLSMLLLQMKVYRMNLKNPR